MEKLKIKERVMYFDRNGTFNDLRNIVTGLRRHEKQGKIENIFVEEDMNWDSYYGLSFFAERMETDEEFEARKEKHAKAQERARVASLTRAQRKEEKEKKEYIRLKQKFEGDGK